MTTFSDMINELSMNLSGYTLQQDRATYLKTAITTTTSTSASPLIMSLGSTENVGKGIVEIDEELLWVDSYDRVGGTATISPYGRGYLGTGPSVNVGVIHSADTKVTIAPTFPRFAIKRAINDTISAVGSSIFAASTTTITSNAAVAAFRLPTTVTLDTTADSLNIRNILSMAYQSIGASKEWVPIKVWRFDGNANTTAFTSGQTISVYDNIPSGRTIQIVYSKDPTPFATTADIFTDKTGLPESCKDLVILGATYRLLSNLDPARASMISPQADETDAKRPYGSSQSITKQIYALFNQRLTEEIRSQQDRYPIRIHYSL